MMTTIHTALPKWILILSGIFALMELLVSVSICLSPESVLETVDLNARGVEYLVYLPLGVFCFGYNEKISSDAYARLSFFPGNVYGRLFYRHLSKRKFIGHQCFGYVCHFCRNVICTP
jgi:hypothetical protein